MLAESSQSSSSFFVGSSEGNTGRFAYDVALKERPWSELLLAEYI